MSCVLISNHVLLHPCERESMRYTNPYSEREGACTLVPKYQVSTVPSARLVIVLTIRHDARLASLSSHQIDACHELIAEPLQLSKDLADDDL